MSDWWKESFIDRKAWILQNYPFFKLSLGEGMVLLMIEHFNSACKQINLATMAAQLNLSEEEVDQILSILCAKKYLQIKANGKQVSFHLDGLYQTKIAHETKVMDDSIFDLFESEFARPLSEKEMTMLSDWIRQYDQKMVVYALREAMILQKKNFNYIDRILSDWQSKGITAQSLAGESK